MSNAPRSQIFTLFEAIGKPVKLTRYFFDDGDEEIAPHSHDDFVHASIAIVGDFEIFDSAGRVVPLQRHHHAQFAVAKEHGLRVKGRIPGAILLSINEPGK